MLNKILRLNHSRTEHRNPLMTTVCRVVTVSVAQYASVRFEGEYAPSGTYRTCYAGPLGIAVGPEDGISEGFPDGARVRWLRGGRNAIALVLASSTPTQGAPDA